MRGLGVLGVLVVAFVGLASPAAAHTDFESSSPSDGSTVVGPLETVVLVFTGESAPAGSGFEVFDPSGTIRRPTEATSTDGRSWVLRFDDPFGAGVVGVRWRVQAPDAHPIDGSFSFTVSAPPTGTRGATEPPTDGAEAPTSSAPRERSASAAAAVDLGPPLAAATGTDGLEAFLDAPTDEAIAAERIGAIARFATLVGTVVAVGALVFIATVIGREPQDVRHVLRWVRVAGLTVIAGAFVEWVAQAVVESGGDWTAIWTPSSLGSALGSALGVAIILRCVGGALVAWGAHRGIDDLLPMGDAELTPARVMAGGVDHSVGRSGAVPGAEPHRKLEPPMSSVPIGAAPSVLGSVALLGAYLFDGHTVTEGVRWFTALVDVVHVAAGSVWAGGVFMLGAVLWRRHLSGRETDTLQLALRFSVVATVALVPVGLAGMALALTILDTPSELWSTTWGRTLVAKTAFVAAAAAAGAYNHRFLIPELGAAPSDQPLEIKFRAVVTAEALALLVVLALTALLMGAAT